MLGQTIANRYKLNEELLSDSLVILYKAQDLHNNKPVLLSLLSEKALARPLEILLRSRRVVEQVSKLNHPGLLKILSIEEVDNRLFFVQEDFDGGALSKFMNQAWDADRAVGLILQIASALELPHQQNLLHQALKPHNILIDEDNNSKVFNFGYAMLQDISRIDEKEEIISTFGYLSPESSGILRKPIDARSDIYSLGILFYQLLTGRLPYEAQDMSSLIHQHIAAKPNPPSKFNTGITPVLDNIILRLIAKEPQERYQSLSGLIFDLMEFQNQRAQGKELIDFEIARFDRLKEISFSTKLIGRDKELELLDGLLGKTKQGQGSLAFVFGEPGIGKSRLVDELRGSIHSLNGLFCGGKCYQFEFRTPYKVFSEAIDAYIEKIKRLSQKEQESHIKCIKDALGELGGEVVKIAPTITDLIGQPPKLVKLEPEKERIRFLITVNNFLTSLSTLDSPLLMFLDDLQWADDGSLEILERFAEKLQNSSVLLIVSYRDNEVDQDHPLARLIKKLKERQIPLSEIPVKFFSIAETSQMISQIIMEKEESVLPLAQKINERTKGNPFFTLELFHTLVDSGIVFLENDHYRYDLNKLHAASLPENIVEIVLKRMSNLAEDTLKILSYASVMGKELNFSLLTELTRQTGDQILLSIEDGVKNQLLYRDLTGRENVFFMHDRIREAFYRRVPEKERIPLHKHIAEVVEDQNKVNIEPVLYDLAYHFSQGKVEDKALQYSLSAANKAKSSYANMLAISLYNSAKEILEKQNRRASKEYMELLENLGETYRLAGEFENSINTFKSCEALIPQQNILFKAQVLSKMGDTLFTKGEIENCAKVMEQALRALNVRLPNTQAGVGLGILKEFAQQMLHTWFPRFFVSDKYRASAEDLIILRILLGLAHVYYFCDMNKAFYTMLKICNISDKVGPSPERAYGYVAIGNAWVTFPWFSRAFRDQQLGLKVAQSIGNSIREGSGYAYLSFTHYAANKPKEGVAYGEKSVEILKKVGEFWDLGVGYSFRHLNYYITGDLKKLFDGGKDFIRTMEQVKAVQNMGWSKIVAYLTYSLEGNLDVSIKDAEDAYALSKQCNDKPTQVWTLAQLGHLYSKKGSHDKALEYTKQALDIFPAYFNKAHWVLDMFSMGAEVYAAKVLCTLNLSLSERKKYLRIIRYYCKQASSWGKKYRNFYGWSLQVNGTYLWLTGHKRRAVRTWDKALNWLRTNKNNPGGDKYRIAYILLEEAKFLLQDNPQDKKALGNLLEAKELFSGMGCKLDLKTCNDLLSKIMPSTEGLEGREALTQRRHLESLLSTTRAIGSIFVLEELLQKILEYGLKVTGAERGFLLLNDDKTSQLSLKVSSGLEKELQGTAFSYGNYKLSLELINEVNNTKSAQIASFEDPSLPKVQVELKNFSVKQAIAVPLYTHDKALGILYMDNRLAGGMFGKDELELMKGFAVQASVSIENAYLVSSLVEQSRLKQELELGKQIQESLLPKESPTIPGLKLAGAMLPAKEIGGDYYDFVTSEDEKAPAVSIVIGDVSGKGVAAGLLMAMAKTAIHTLSQEQTSPREVLLRTNQILVKHIGAQKFMTMLYFRYDTNTKTLTYSSAGHEHILIYRSSQQKVEATMSGGFMLGMVADISAFLEDKIVALQPGDKIILYTDGVTEARNIKEELFSLERLMDLIQKHGSESAEQLLVSIKEEVYSYIGVREQYDDITLVVMEAI